MGQCLGVRKREARLSRNTRRRYNKVVGDEFDDDEDIAMLASEGGGIGDDLDDGAVLASPVSSPIVGQGFAIVREKGKIIDDDDWD
eukprot:m.69523 g.69523  ORF g.69523 m.69523 type:complete len:86 (-) comp24101_c0_seq2:185-442(-)